MAEFGATLCSNPGCSRHDFLPFTCPACGRVFCQEHMAIGSGHVCDDGEAYLASRRGYGESATSASPPTSGTTAAATTQKRPSEYMSEVTSRFDGREDELNATVTHLNIKSSKGEAADGDAGAPDKVLKNAQLAMGKATTAKGKRVSTQVHRMLLKSKAAGDKNLRAEDRFFLEVHYSGNDTDVHHLFFSRLWTVGRTLDEVLKTRRRHLRLKPGEEDRPLELARENSPSGLPTGGVLHDLPPEQLQSFDVVEVRPRAKLPDSSSSSVPPTSAGSSSSSSSSSPPRIAVTAADMGKVDERGAGRTDLGIASEGAASATETATTNAGGGNSERGGGGGGGGGREGMTITIGHGKAVYELGGVVPDQVSVLDIKRRLEPITGVPFLRQKLLFKGVLRDGDRISATKIQEGAKVMLLGSAAAAAAAAAAKK